jgi:hypothetical protein
MVPMYTFYAILGRGQNRLPATSHVKVRYASFYHQGTQEDLVKF